MEPKGLVIQPGQGPVWDRSEGRSVALKLLSGETAESVMMFEETAPPGTATGYHLHHNSDEIAYVLSGETTFKIGDQNHGRRSRHVCIHATRHPARMEEHGSRSRTDTFQLYAGRGGKVVRGIATVETLARRYG